MSDYQTRKTFVIDAIIREDQLGCSMEENAIRCATGDDSVSFTAVEAITLAEELTAEARSEAHEDDDMIDWIAELRRNAIRLLNT